MEATIKDLTTQLSNTFRYNLQVLPDTMMASVLLFALLFQSAAIAIFALCLLLHAGLYQVFASFLGRNIPGVRSPSSSERCTGRFPGATFLGAANMSANSVNNVNYVDNEWPSYYASFMGFFLGYLGAMPYIYKQELAASPARSISTTGGLVIGCIVLLMCVVFRLASGCDDVIGATAGIAIGGIMGYVLVNLIAYASNRSLTNVLALPLLTGTASNGKPIYVCAPKA
jgi:hypothetical protein